MNDFCGGKFFVVVDNDDLHFVISNYSVHFSVELHGIDYS